jgi:hypothetical protein
MNRPPFLQSPFGPFHSAVQTLLRRIFVPSYLVSVGLPLLGGILCLPVAACSPQRIAIPSNLLVSAKKPDAWPTPPVAAPNAPPRIVRMWVSTLRIEPGSWFDGTIVASSNVASVEVRTAAFSINSTHAGPGIFRFHTHVLELPPLSRGHSYELYFIARNTAGVEEVEEAPLNVE